MPFCCKFCKFLVSLHFHGFTSSWRNFPVSGPLLPHNGPQCALACLKFLPLNLTWPHCRPPCPQGHIQLAFSRCLVNLQFWPGKFQLATCHQWLVGPKVQPQGATTAQQNPLTPPNTFLLALLTPQMGICPMSCEFTHKCNIGALGR